MLVCPLDSDTNDGVLLERVKVGGCQMRASEIIGNERFRDGRALGQPECSDTESS